jgi:transposase
LQKLADFFGVQIVILSSYSPDYNPIEKTFYALKTFIRRHAKVAKMFSANFKGFL